jgi:hypothetical protein
MPKQTGNARHIFRYPQKRGWRKFLFTNQDNVLRDVLETEELSSERNFEDKCKLHSPN